MGEDSTLRYYSAPSSSTSGSSSSNSIERQQELYARRVIASAENELDGGNSNQQVRSRDGSSQEQYQNRRESDSTESDLNFLIDESLWLPNTNTTSMDVNDPMNSSSSNSSSRGISNSNTETTKQPPSQYPWSIKVEVDHEPPPPPQQQQQVQSPSAQVQHTVQHISPLPVGYWMMADPRQMGGHGHPNQVPWMLATSPTNFSPYPAWSLNPYLQGTPTSGGRTLIGTQESVSGGGIDLQNVFQSPKSVTSSQQGSPPISNWNDGRNSSSSSRHSVPDDTFQAQLEQPYIFRDKYQRNNKKGGKKHLRCFPFCGPNHKSTSACEFPVRLSYSRSGGQAMQSRTTTIDTCGLVAFARFVCVTEESNTMAWDFERPPDEITGLDRDIKVGESVPIERVERCTKSTDNPLASLYPSQLVQRQVHAQGEVGTFEFHERAWHYGWTAGRYRQKMQHCLRLYIFETNQAANTYICKAIVNSPVFKIFSSRIRYTNNKRKRRESE